VTKLLQGDPHDDALAAQVRPAGWANPAPAPRYHLVVVGGGTAGLVCAAGAAGLGAHVALVERGLLGGDCLNAGCVPSKALLASARAASRARGAEALGIQGAGARVDFSAVMARLRRVRARLAVHDSAERLRGLGVDVFLGEGRFTGPATLTVGGAELRFRKAVIATGARPHIPPDVSAGLVLTNETVFALTELPPRLTVLGAGPVGCELAQAFARLGSRVTLCDRGPRILHREDEDAALLVQRSLEADGVTFLPNTSRAEGEVALVAAGRRPNVEGMGLEAAGVAWSDRGVRVDDFLRTTNPNIYAAGDVTGRYAFTHAADAMARMVIRNALFWGWSRLSRLVVPWCTYTSPELGRVGMSLAEGRAVGADVFEMPMSSVDRAALDGEAEGLARVLARRGRIVGATVAGSGAGDLVGVIALAMARGLGLSDLSSAVFPYPTRLEALRKLGDAYNRTRLTPWARGLLRWWLGG
jgi:pyruvate/2-oxoglutarate dehydrogenase complex dihydrolipoamide dehydrogenase (E3) component